MYNCEQMLYYRWLGYQQAIAYGAPHTEAYARFYASDTKLSDLQVVELVNSY